MEQAFREQRDVGGPLGPGGPGWALEDVNAPNGHGLCHYPESVRQQFAEGAAFTADGKMWPRPTFILCEPTDAVLVLHSTPHCATRVEAADPRFMIYFRLTPAARPEVNRGCFPEASGAFASAPAASSCRTFSATNHVRYSMNRPC